MLQIGLQCLLIKVDLDKAILMIYLFYPRRRLRSLFTSLVCHPTYVQGLTLFRYFKSIISGPLPRAVAELWCWGSYLAG